MKTVKLARPTLDEVNHVLSAIQSDARFEVREGRLWIVTEYGESAAVNGRTGWYPAFRYGRLGMGGTRACATMQLAHWYRGKPRVPVATWAYWCSPPIRLGDQCPELLKRITESSYGDTAATCCVLCGAERIGDWWSRDGVNGPVCGWTTGCRQQATKERSA